jgi:hypothetical protein
MKKKELLLVYDDIYVEMQVPIVDIVETFYYSGESDIWVDYEEAIEKVATALVGEKNLTATELDNLKQKIENHFDLFMEEFSDELENSEIIQTAYKCYRKEVEALELKRLEEDEDIQDEINVIGLERTFRKADPEFWDRWEQETKEEARRVEELYKEVYALDLSEEEKEKEFDIRCRKLLGISEPTPPVVVPISPKRPEQESNVSSSNKLFNFSF